MSVVGMNGLQMPRKRALESLATIAAGLRQEDRDEALAATGGDPQAILRQSFDVSSHVWFAMAGEEPVAVYGAAPSSLAGVGVVWMMGTPGVERNGLSIARQTRGYLDEMHDTYHMLWNFIDARNELSLNWLLWSGFNVIGADPAYGHEGRLFYEFARVG